MKVITPLVKPKSVSQQMKNQFTPVGTPDTEKKDGASPRPPQFSKYNSATILNSTFQPILSDSTETGDRETVIDAGPAGHSPVLPRSGKMEWDSQGEDSPTTPRRAADLPGYPALVLPPVPTSVKSRSASNFHEENDRQGSTTLRMGRSPNPAAAIHATKTDQTRAQTLPASSKNDPPKLSDYADSDSAESEEDNTSSFANALRESRAKIKRKSSLPRVQRRERSNTMPSTPPQRSSPLLVKRSVENGPEDKMSPLQLEVLKASQERSNRVSLQQSRLTKVQSVEGDRNSLADVLSRRLDSMNSKIKSPNESDDSFDDSPKLLPGNRSLSARANATPDTHMHEQGTKPASKATPPSVKPKPARKERQGRSESPLVEVDGIQKDKTTGLSSLPWEAKLRSAPKEAKILPVGNDGASLKPGEKPASSKGGKTSLSDPASQEQGALAFILPPPLPDSNQRLSFIDSVDPPPAFMLEMDETSTDEIVSPHSIELRSHMPLSKEQQLRPASPTPPPLPQSPPPPKIPSATSVFAFPEPSNRSRDSTMSPDSLPFSLPTPDITDLPSPLPSPTRERSAFSTSPLPPPSFGGSDAFGTPKTYPLENRSTFTPISPETEAQTLPLFQDEPPPRPPLPSETPPPVPSESPPPLPSTEPPLLLDSDVSLDQASISMVTGDVHSESSSSPGSSPQSYSVSTVPRELSPTSERLVEAREMGGGANSPKVAPLVSKKPKRGFYIPSPEKECAPQEVVTPVKEVTSEIPLVKTIAPEPAKVTPAVPPPVPVNIIPAKEVSIHVYNCMLLVLMAQN